MQVLKVLFRAWRLHTSRIHDSVRNGTWTSKKRVTACMFLETARQPTGWWFCVERNLNLESFAVGIFWAFIDFSCARAIGSSAASTWVHWFDGIGFACAGSAGADFGCLLTVPLAEVFWADLIHASAYFFSLKTYFDEEFHMWNTRARASVCQKRER